MTDWQDMTDVVLDATTAAFGESVILRPGENDQQDLVGIFRAAHVPVDPETGTAISAADPVLSIRLADVRGAPIRGGKPGTVISVRGVRYRVVEVRPDGEGGARLALTKAAP